MNRQIATFLLGDTLLGVDILLIKEVYRHMIISPIPDAPRFLRGLMNLRGRVVTIIDLNLCLNRPEISEINDGRLLIFKTQDEIINYKRKGELLENVNLGEDIFGFLIDKMDDVLTVEDDAIFPPPPNIADIEENLIAGLVKQGDRLVILLNVSAVLERVISVTNEAKEIKN